MQEQGVVLLCNTVSSCSRTSPSPGGVGEIDLVVKELLGKCGKKEGKWVKKKEGGRKKPNGKRKKIGKERLGVCSDVY